MKRLGPARSGIFPYAGRGGRRFWAVDYRCPLTSRRRRQAGLATRAEAMVFAERMERQRAGLEPAGERGLLFDTLVARFVEDYRPRSGDTAYYEERSRVWLRYLGGLRADRITPDHVGRMAAHRAERVSPSTVRKDLVSLATMFRWARARGLVATDPTSAQLVRRPPKDSPDPRPLTDAEVRRLLRSCVKWLRPVVEFCVLTGADRGEAVRLNWSQVDRRRMLIRLPRSKTGQPRVIPYRQAKRLRAVLAEAAQDGRSGPVFRGARGYGIAIEAAKTAMRWAWSEALPGHPRPWKSLRATFATRMIERGVDVAAVAALMGLSGLHVFEHYYRARAKHLEAAMGQRVRRVRVESK